MQEKCFKLYLKDKTYKIPFKCDHLMHISEDISSSLIFGPQHHYQVKSNVTDEVFQSFIKYLANSERPDIQLSNIHQYIELSQEFQILQEMIDEKKSEFGEYFVNLNGLKNEDSSIYEEQIAKKLDDYLEGYSELLMQSDIQTLHRIFNHEERRLTKHDLAYEMIKRQFEVSNNFEVFVLLDSLDGAKMARSSLEECLLLEDDRSGHKPKIEWSYLAKSFEKQRELEEIIVELESEIKTIKDEHARDIEKMTKLIENLSSKINEIDDKHSNKISTIESKHDEDKILVDAKIEKQAHDVSLFPQKLLHFFLCEMSMESPGIFATLKNKEKTPFDRLFVASQSSDDIYNLINPYCEEVFSTSNEGKFYIEFELKVATMLNGIKIFSGNSYFPKSFDIEVDGQKMKSIEEANELNGKNKEMIVNFDQIKCRKIRIIQTGRSWDQGDNYLHFKGFELLSSESKYSEGVFKTLIYNNEKHDPHMCPVIISASKFDFNSFHLLDSDKNICTSSLGNSWFQVELIGGFAVINGFRLKRCEPGKLKSYKIIGTNDVNEPINKWTVLFKMDENDKEEHKKLDIYEFSHPSPPVKFVRLMQTGPNWSNSLFLKLIHFDLFGIYF